LLVFSPAYFSIRFIVDQSEGGSMDLKGKNALITGASSGIGEATALMLGKAGVKVAIVARRKDRLDDLAKRIKSSGGEALVIEADVTDKKICQKVVNETLSKLDHIDILVNNAGVMLLGPSANAPLEEWEQMIKLNLLGLLYMTYATLPSMRKRKSGHIVNISSVAGRTNTAGSAVYNATKWGVNAFTESLRQELVGEKSGIRTTIIEPGAVATELISHNRPEVQESLKDRWKDMKKRLEADDIARGIVYAVSQPLHVNVNEILIRPTEQPG
jgi:NADP-dependent 3-hydroxy acid dehydrogenase YdfG